MPALRTLKYSFTVLGEPKGKGRPRFTKTGRTYTPNDTMNYEGAVWNAFRAKYEEAEQIGGAFSIVIRAYFGIPKSASKKKREMMLTEKIRPTKKPDIDNITKIIMDALNGTAFGDDAGAVGGTIDKYYGAVPRVEVEIYEEAKWL